MDKLELRKHRTQRLNGFKKSLKKHKKGSKQYKSLNTRINNYKKKHKL